ncbi:MULTISPECIES: hypothetical protein [unclassified Variovorax]|uniref:hypothetical protein n=1 Tax=unclassified Variovorax TaxID=663243 RepID=UPI000B070651|nr:MULTISPECIES: hypothetical protein [unclassified Variovorax]PNG53321.1 hypothetical protein CHC06_04668 [Variovorax sp. B2]PNG53893.1 hypothetical protein CHC07_03715 [Variovorax sp. B4]VTV11358.1 hypothetical protein WDL1CHR_02229 [Variovorax sp. WDL1]
MKITIWQPKAPATVSDMKDDFAQRLGAFRAATGRTERFVTRCACAVHDRGFAVVYERTDPTQPFVISGIYRDGEGDGTVQASEQTKRRELPAREIDTTGWRCPHCATGGITISCGRCGDTICGGRTKTYHGMAPVFSCRASCGARGALEDADKVTGAEVASRAARFRDQQGARSSAGAAPCLKPPVDALRLK